MTRKEFEATMGMFARMRAVFKDDAAKDRELAQKLAEVEGIIQTNIDPRKFSPEPDFSEITKIKK